MPEPIDLMDWQTERYVTAQEQWEEGNRLLLHAQGELEAQARLVAHLERWVRAAYERMQACSWAP